MGWTRAQPDFSYFLERLTFINPDGLGIFLPGFFIFLIPTHSLISGSDSFSARLPTGQGNDLNRHNERLNAR